jgi:hypothetical protein
MKKLLVIFAFLGMSLTLASAQEEDQLIFNHLGIGVSVGTTALGINVSTVLTPYFGLRAGVNLWPILKLRSNLHLGSRIQNWEPGDIAKYAQELNEVLSEDEQVPMEMPEAMSMHIKPKLTAGHLLIDYYPFPHSSNFHLTTGFHLGTGTVVDIHNRHEGSLMPVTAWNNAMENPDAQEVVERNNLQPIGLVLGDYFIAPDENGNIDARIRVSGFRPYLGLGFGRAVPRKRIGCQFDLGVQFWGSPKVMVNGEELKPDKVGEELDDVLSIVSRIKVFPVLSFRLVGRIF